MADLGPKQSENLAGFHGGLRDPWLRQFALAARVAVPRLHGGKL
jgi:hypothetical protein